MSRPACCREKDAAHLIRTIVSVVAHCHHLGVIHRRALHAAACTMHLQGPSFAHARIFVLEFLVSGMDARCPCAAYVVVARVQEALLACCVQLMLRHRVM